MRSNSIIAFFLLILFISCSQNLKKSGLESTNSETIQEATEVNQENTLDYSKYTVQRGDTLMLISFKVYGDYSKWKVLLELNKDILQNGSNLEAGIELNYVADKNDFETPQGLPYLIKNADTLTKISFKVYGKTRWWDEIYFNNQRMIRDPNKLYSGFVIYYPEVESLEIVQKNMLSSNFTTKNKRRIPANQQRK
jgi:phage tail protein X